MSISSVIAVKQGDKRIYLYGHNMADRSIKHAKKGLRSGRVGQSAYLTRIIFSSMISIYDEVADETGYGISATRIGSDCPMIVIDGESSEGYVWLEDQFSEKPLTKPVTGAEFLKIAKGVKDLEKLQAKLPQVASFPIAA